MSSITAIIATPSASELQGLRAALASAPDIRLLAECPGLMEVFTSVEQSPPDIVIIARELTLVPEFEVMRGLFETLDVRWLAVDRARTPSGAQDRAGDLFGLRPGISPAGLVMQIRAVTHAARAARRAPKVPSLPPRSPGKLILIGASTGGVDALANILSVFPGNCPPTVIVQHTSRGFGDGLVRLLGLRCQARVVACRDGLELTTGMVCIAAGTPCHAVLSGVNPPRMTFGGSELVSGHVPSIDKLFVSAVPSARQVAAALLTGMGSDGAEGLLALRRAGATTMSQDAATSVVYGMPRAAWKNGGSEVELPLNRIGPALLQSARVSA